MVFMEISQDFKGEIPMKVVTHNTTQVKNIQTYIQLNGKIHFYTGTKTSIIYLDK